MTWTVKCEARLITGPREGTVCNRRATMIAGPVGEFVCGTHARAWSNAGLARIAYWKPKEQAWW